MSELTFDEVTDRAWARFMDDLAGYLRRMRAGDSLVLESHYDGAVAPDSTDELRGRARVRLTARAEDVYRCEVPRNIFLNPLRTLDGPDHEGLARLGFKKPDQCSHEEPAPGHNGSGSYYVDAGPRTVAALVVAVFRLTWSMPDPAFLRARAAGRPDVPEFDAWGPEIAEDAPESALQILVEAAVADMFGDSASVDDEGVITLNYGGSHVHLRVEDIGGYVDVYAGILKLAEPDCEEEFDLTREVLDAIPRLNLQWPSVKWHMSERTLLGVVRIDGAPFMPQHLKRALKAIADLLDAADDILTELTSDAEASGHPGGQALLQYSLPPGARSVLEAPNAGEGEPSAAADTIVAVLRLNTGATRGLADDEVADLCEGDVDLVLQCLRIAKAELHHWQSDDSDPAARDEEAGGWAVVIDKLLGAIAALSRSGQ